MPSAGQNNGVGLTSLLEEPVSTVEEEGEGILDIAVIVTSVRFVGSNCTVLE